MSSDGVAERERMLQTFWGGDQFREESSLLEYSIAQKDDHFYFPAKTISLNPKLILKAKRSLLEIALDGEHE